MRINLAAILLLVALQGAAQESIFLDEALTLEQAIQLGLVNNFDIRLSELDYEIAARSNSIGMAGLLPSLRFVGTSANRFSDADNPASFLNGKYRNLSVTPAIQLDWTLFDGMRAHISKKRLALLEEQSDGNVAVVVERGIQDIVEAYRNVLLQSKRIRIFRDLTRLSGERLDYIEYKKDLGAATTFELVQERRRYYEDSIALVLQEHAFANGVRTLNLVMGAEPTANWRLQDQLQTQFDTLTYAVMMGDVLHNNATLINQYIQVAILQKDRKLAGTDLYPRLDLQGFGSYSRSSFKLEQQAEALPGTSWDYGVNFTLGWNLFNGGRTIKQLRNARTRESVAKTGAQQIEHTLRIAVLNTLKEFTSRQKVHRLNDVLVADTKLNLELADERFRSGVITSFEYRDVQIADLNAELQRLENLVLLNNLHTELIRLRGGIIEMGGAQEP